MLQNIRKKWLNSTQLTYLNLFVLIGALGFSSYVEYSRVMPICAFCLTVRSLLLVLLALSISVFFVPAYRRLLYPAQLGLSVTGLLLTLRQFYFEKMVTRLVACPKQAAGALQTMGNWLAKGAPACQKTPVIAYLPFSAWAYIVFVILSLIAFRLYYKRAKRGK